MAKVGSVLISGALTLLLTLASGAAPAKAATQEQILALITRILNDPMLPESAHGARLEAEPEAGHRFIKYKLINAGKIPTGIWGNFYSCALYPRDDDVFDFSISLAPDDVSEVTEEPDWNRMEAQWDAFIARHWPHLGLERLDDWRREIFRYASGSQSFSIQYAVRRQEALLFRVILNIRLADGKIGGVATQQADVLALSQNRVVPPPPDKQAILSAFVHVLQQRHEQALGEVPARAAEWPELRNLRITNTWRFTMCVNDQIVFDTAVNLQGETPDGKIFIVSGSYFEQAGLPPARRIENLSIVSQERLDEMHQRPFTRVIDSEPQWSADGRRLYFVTTRDPRGRPWWQRAIIPYVPSLAVYDPRSSANAPLTLFRPVKLQGTDAGIYGHPSPSPSGRYLAGTGPTAEQKLFVLDAQSGTVYLPRRDPSWSRTLQEHFSLPPEAVPQGPHWVIERAQWLADESGLLLAMYADWSDLDLYLIRHNPANPPQTWEVTPVLAERGDDTLPCLSNGERTLAWANKPFVRSTAAGATSQPEQWNFIVADFDRVTGRISNRRTLQLRAKPDSISWDERSKRWLVVLENGMVWIKEQNSALQAASVAELSWEGMPLKPIFAAVAPQGGRIAIAAELSQSRVYDNTQCVVASAIFLWDGQNLQVRPLFDPSLNGIPRFTFPSSHTTWARIIGDVGQFGLDRIADSSYFGARGVSASPNAAPQPHR